MSWISKVADALEAAEAASEERMNAIEKLVVSRQATVAVLETEISEYKRQMELFPVASPARVALTAIVRTKEQRLARVRVELEGFRQAAVDPRQVEFPKSRK